MSTATNVQIHHSAPSRNKNIAQRGWSYIRGRATLPVGNASCTVTNIPGLTDQSIVMIMQNGNYGNTAPIINIKASNTNGMDGTITAGTADTSVVTSDAAFSFIIKTP